MSQFSDKLFCIKGGKIIDSVYIIEELATYIKDYILNSEYNLEWCIDIIKGATRQAIYNIIWFIVG